MHFFRLLPSLTIISALAYCAAIPADGTSPGSGSESSESTTAARSMLRSSKVGRSEQAVASNDNETTNVTSSAGPSMDAISRHGNITAVPTSFQNMESLIRTMQAMTDRDRQFLISHNTRRKVWHERYGKSYVPLKWDNSLKADAKVWAEHLLASCGKGMYHDPNTSYGECATANQGTGSFAKLHTPDEIVRRYVEREEGWQFPKNSHLTQVLWRSTKYVGCAEASKSMGQGKMCHTQVCRYARPGEEIRSYHRDAQNACATRPPDHSLSTFHPPPSFDRILQHPFSLLLGNCNMGKYKSDRADWWIEPMMMEEGGLCGPACPPNGCH